MAAASRCLVTRGTTRLTVEDVAQEAAVVRSTVYRYFRSRDELILGVVLSRIDIGMRRLLGMLEHPDDAARSVVDLIVYSVGFVTGDPLNEALFAKDSRGLVTSLELRSEAVVDAFHRHLGPLLAQWRAEGQLREDLDLREISRWMNTVGLLLLGPPWTERSEQEKREFVECYILPGLLPRATGG
ncbi:helix-turn-helix transcriptional regulator [Frankia sp. CNm7]|uniref:Helix-turn-helix transcriptional regulator n=1 Tax=Frankia nepalensis TaxID=1836974 RepID=A0A937RKX1_9ACTN|nr:helix-turn-helix transcriptional regulator [Frankia nepalensis]MBL7509088.1 helix-turn-helix transcriptional regulator [Frankia nepalensis]MBL7516809.1 helix-turn-helix transcriptional regulator [Frankia nepalensis]MBL7627806.1 helix-turn-helix transcriptional regulator [Frankia nepalensis]